MNRVFIFKIYFSLFLFCTAVGILAQENNQTTLSSESATSNALTLNILMPNLTVNTNGQLVGSAILKNVGLTSLPICTKVFPLGGNQIIEFNTDIWFGEAPDIEMMAASIRQVKPGDSVTIPLIFNLSGLSLPPGDNVVSCYAIYSANCEKSYPLYHQNLKLKMWRGKIKSAPIQVHVLK